MTLRRVSAFLLLLTACGGDDTTSDAGDTATSADASIDADGGRADTGLDASEDAGSDAGLDADCERCGGAECVDRERDALHCGECDNACPAAPGSVPICIEGTCDERCEDGLADCDGDPDNGCETRLDDPSTCGSCDIDCGSPAAGAAMCTAGVCAVACDAGFGDCDGMLANGCESDFSSTLTCTSCDMTCAAAANSTPACTGDGCSLICDAGFADCGPEPGCEVDTTTDVMNCGECGARCPMGINAILLCVSGVCEDRCEVGFDRCLSPDCTTDITNTTAHCGGCGMACSVRPNANAAQCEDSACVNVCSTGRGDCDGDVTNGCEVDTTDDNDHCGGCDIVCGVGELCQASACVRRPVAFVTSTTVIPNDMGPGLGGFDALCADRATAAGLPGTFLAWVSNATGSPSSRFTRSAIGYARTDGVTIADTWGDLTDGSLDATIDRDESGTLVPITGVSCATSVVVTGTRFTGAPLSGFDCNNYSGGTATGVAGEPNTTGTRWSQGCGGTFVCRGARRVYCFEQ